MSEKDRQLAAVMFTDIEGYTALMHENEPLAQEWRARHRKAFKETHQTFDGRIIQYFGDGSLSIFDSALKAVHCAIEIQRLLRAGDTKVPLRIGLHLGEIVLKDGDIFGDGVNIASRVESFSVPGAVLISDRLYEQIRNHHIPCRSMGFFHLKNVSREVELFAVIEEDLVIPDKAQMAGKGAEINKVIFNNLPKQTNAFVGRETELQELPRFIRKNRLVTMTGPGGTGKTRLSLAVAENLALDFDDGVCWVALAPLVQANQVVFTIAQALALPQDTTLSLEAILIKYLSSRKMLLLLDNFEHVTDAAVLVGQLLRHCAELHILVTSRVTLKIYGEQEYPLAPLSLPEVPSNSPESLETYSSIELFCARAQTVKPNFQLTSENASTIAEICIRLDGLPLAIELAAARIKIFPPQLLLSKLNENFTFLKGGWIGQDVRHHTLSETIAWSYRLLEPQEQLLFQFMSVFAGGGTLEAIESICLQGDLQDWDVTEGVIGLAEKSLIQKQEEGNSIRFVMLETIRFYARDILTQSVAEEAIKKAHALYYLELAEQAQPHLTGKDQVYWLTLLGKEQDNFRSAIQWCIDHQAYREANRFGIALWRFWLGHSLLIEGVSQLNKLLSLPKIDEEGRLMLLHALGTLFFATTEFQKALPIFEEILNIRKGQNNPKDLANALNNLGWCLIQTGHTNLGFTHTQRALDIFIELGDKRGEAASYNNFAQGFQVEGQPSEAASYHEKCLHLRQILRDDRGTGYTLASLALSKSFQGDYSASLKLVEEALFLLNQVKDQVFISWANIVSALLYFEMDDMENFSRMIHEIENKGNHIGTKYLLGYTNLFKAILATHKGQKKEADDFSKQSLQILNQINFVPVLVLQKNIWVFSVFKSQDFQQAYQLCKKQLPENFKDQQCSIFLIQNLEIVAYIFTKWEKHQKALKILAKTNSLRTEMNVIIPLRMKPFVDKAFEMLHKELKPNEFEENWNEGLNLSIEDTIQLAIQEDKKDMVIH